MHLSQARIVLKGQGFSLGFSRRSVHDRMSKLPVSLLKLAIGRRRVQQSLDRSCIAASRVVSMVWLP